MDEAFLKGERVKPDMGLLSVVPKKLLVVADLKLISGIILVSGLLKLSTMNLSVSGSSSSSLSKSICLVMMWEEEEMSGWVTNC